MKRLALPPPLRCYTSKASRWTGKNKECEKSATKEGEKGKKGARYNNNRPTSFLATMRYIVIYLFLILKWRIIYWNNLNAPLSAIFLPWNNTFSQEERVLS